jgi:hypothetical protein
VKPGEALAKTGEVYSFFEFYFEVKTKPGLAAKTQNLLINSFSPLPLILSDFAEAKLYRRTLKIPLQKPFLI